MVRWHDAELGWAPWFGRRKAGLGKAAPWLTQKEGEGLAISPRFQRRILMKQQIKKKQKDLEDLGHPLLCVLGYFTFRVSSKRLWALCLWPNRKHR